MFIQRFTKFHRRAAVVILALALTVTEASSQGGIDENWPKNNFAPSRKKLERKKAIIDGSRSNILYVDCVKKRLAQPSFSFFWESLKDNRRIMHPGVFMVLVYYACSEGMLDADESAALSDEQKKELRFFRRAALFDFWASLGVADDKNSVARFTLGNFAGGAGYLGSLDKDVKAAEFVYNTCMEHGKTELSSTSAPADEIARVIVARCADPRKYLSYTKCARQNKGECHRSENDEKFLTKMSMEQERELSAEVAIDIIRRREKQLRANLPIQRAQSPEDLFKAVSGAVYVVVSTSSGQNGQLSTTTQGSAVAVSDRTLLTNCHVIGDSSQVLLHSNGQFDLAAVASRDIDADRCTLISAKTLGTKVDIRPYADINVGEKVFAIGAPKGAVLGLGLSFADGIVSAKRSLGLRNLIQTTAPISPGSSGGGLFDSAGRLVGITTFTVEGGQNLNFAIAADQFSRR